MINLLARGKRIDNSQWIQGYYTKERSEQGPICSFITSENGNYAEVDEKTVGQFSGLVDENRIDSQGKTKLFAGDIVRILGGEHFQGSSELDDVCIVSWQTTGFELVSVKSGVGIGLGWGLDYDSITYLGNIYDNPEIMERYEPKAPPKVSQNSFEDF